MAILNPRGIPYPLAPNGLPYMDEDDPVHELNEWTNAFASNIDLNALGAAAASHTHPLSSMSGNLSSDRVNFVPKTFNWWENEDKTTGNQTFMNIGTGMIRSGYITMGKVVLCWGMLQRSGASPVPNQGSGWYNFVLPSKPASYREVFGGGRVFSHSTTYDVVLRSHAANGRVRMKYLNGAKAGQDMDNSPPAGGQWPNNASTWFSWWAFYQAA